MLWCKGFNTYVPIYSEETLVVILSYPAINKRVVLYIIESRLRSFDNLYE